MYKLEKLMTNPLIQAYRKPNMYVTLPSGGRFYKDKPKLSADNELAVYAMTARDELITKTPDALFNGEATVSLIKSCCPDIKEPNNMPVSDMLVILVGIRQASFGKDIDVDVKCPECEHTNQLTLDASAMLSNTKSTTSDQEVVIQDDIKVTCNPYTLGDRTTLQVQQIKQQKMIASLADTQLDDQGRQELFGKTLVEIAELTNSISSVNANGEAIVDKEMIKEWLQTITKKDYDLIKNKVEELSESGLETAFNAKCQECQHEWKTGVDLDIANFFVG